MATKRDLPTRPLTDGARARTVLFVTNTPMYGGAEQHLVGLIDRLAPDLAPFILCLGADPFTERLRHSPHVRVAGPLAVRTLWQWLRFIRSIRPDTILFVNSWLWGIPWQAPLAARLARVRRVHSIQHFMPPPLPPPSKGHAPLKGRVREASRQALQRLSLRMSASLCDTVICVSNATRDSLITSYGFPARSTLTIHNGIAVSRFSQVDRQAAAIRARLGGTSDDFILVCTARLVKQKGVELLIEAMSQLLGDGLPCKCIVLGDGPDLDRLQERATALGVATRVFFEGFQEDVRPYLQAADAFVLTSSSEGLSLSVLEAMASGLPCVLSNVGGNGEAITHGVEGLLVRPGSVDQIASAIAYLMTHPRERRRMSEQARHKVSALFEIESRMAELQRAIFT